MFSTHSLSPRDAKRTAGVPARAGRWGGGAAALGRKLFGVAATAVVVLATVGCVARAGARGRVAYQAPVVVYQPPTVEVEVVPVEVQVVPEDVEYYPSHAYGGGSVYLVEGRWYTHSRGRWEVYHREPRALASVRVSYEAKYGRHYRPTRKGPKNRGHDRKH